MKKVVLLITLLSIFQFNYAQNILDNRHEVKFNAAYLLAGIPEVGYTYLLTEETTLGIDVLFSIDDDVEPFFALTPNYRFHFGHKPAAGFFAEVFAMLNTTESVYVDMYSTFAPGSVIPDYDDKETDLALGIAIGGKFLTKKGFVFEIYGGLGRNLFNDKSLDFIPRMGLTFGKRF